MFCMITNVCCLVSKRADFEVFSHTDYTTCGKPSRREIYKGLDFILFFLLRNMS